MVALRQLETVFVAVSMGAFVALMFVPLGAVHAFTSNPHSGEEFTANAWMSDQGSHFGRAPIGLQLMGPALVAALALGLWRLFGQAPWWAPALGAALVVVAVLTSDVNPFLWQLAEQWATVDGRQAQQTGIQWVETYGVHGLVFASFCASLGSLVGWMQRRPDVQAELRA